jgi:Cellulose binding domain
MSGELTGRRGPRSRWRASVLLMALVAAVAVLSTGLGPARATARTGRTVAEADVVRTPSAPRCDPQWSTATAATPATFEVTSPNRIRFAYSAPAGAGCSSAPGLATTTVTVYTDAAGRQEAGRATSGAGSTAGSVRVEGLSPNVDYYYSVQASNTSPHGGIAGPVRTPASTGPTSSTPPDWCRIGAEGTFTAATTATLVFTYADPGAGLCGTAVRVQISTDALGQNPVKVASTPSGSDSGTIVVGGLTPDTAYWYRFVGSSFVPTTTEGPVRTLPVPPTTPPSCPGAARVISQSFAPSAVRPGGQATEYVTVENCGPAAITLHLQWTARWNQSIGVLPPGCPGIDPLLRGLTIPGYGQASDTLTYTVPAGCTATDLTGYVEATDAEGVSGSADLRITDTPVCPGDADLQGVSFTPSTVVAGSTATELATVRNCGSAPVTTQVQWAPTWVGADGSGAVTGCPILQAVRTPVTVLVGQTMQVSRTYGVPVSCTATALRSVVSLPLVSGTPTVTATLSITPATCTATVSQHTWTGGFTLGVTVTNLGPALSGWTVSFAFGGDQKLTSTWSAVVSQSGANVTATNPAWGTTLPQGGSASFGGNGTWQSSSAAPSVVALNGHPCATTVSG